MINIFHHILPEIGPYQSRLYLMLKMCEHLNKNRNVYQIKNVIKNMKNMGLCLYYSRPTDKMSMWALQYLFGYLKIKKKQILFGQIWYKICLLAHLDHLGLLHQVHLYVWMGRLLVLMSIVVTRTRIPMGVTTSATTTFSIHSWKVVGPNTRKDKFSSFQLLIFSFSNY